MRTGVDGESGDAEIAAFGGLLSVVREDPQARMESHTLLTHVDDGVTLVLTPVGREGRRALMVSGGSIVFSVRASPCGSTDILQVLSLSVSIGLSFL